MKRKILLIAIIAALIGSCKKNAEKENDEGKTISIKSKLKDVIGGNQILITSAPYQVAIFENGQFNGGGVILDQNWILTAAHLVTDGNNQIPAGDLTIRAGSTNVNDGISVNVDQVIRNPNYLTTAIYNDIALLHLTTPLSLSTSIQPINYAKNAESILINNLAIVSGWGLISFNSSNNTGTLPVNLFAADVKISGVESNLIYTSSTTSSQQSPCYGDSGGPLTATDIYGNNLLIGIVNGWGDCNIGAKGYARVSAFSDWILQQTGISGVIGVPVISSDIIGPSTISRGVEYMFHGNNLPSGATLTWTLPSSIGTITDGQGTSSVTIFTISTGTQSINSTIKLKVVDSYGNSKNISNSITLKSGR